MVRLVEGLLKGEEVDLGVEHLAKEVKSLEAYLLAECKDKATNAESERDTQTTESLDEVSPQPHPCLLSIPEGRRGPAQRTLTLTTASSASLSSSV